MSRMHRCCAAIRLYRTYEELKLLDLSHQHIASATSLYRTYEELKHVSKGELVHTLAGLYRTYEELKLGW